MPDQIVVPLDGSSFGEHALPVALEVADRSGARLELVRVVELPEDLVSTPDRQGVAPMDDARSYLARVARGIGSSGEGEIERVVLRGSPAWSLLERVEETGAHLVIMSSHGHGPLSRVWLGSVTDKVLRGASIPVLLTRPTPGRDGDGGSG